MKAVLLMCCRFRLCANLFKSRISYYTTLQNSSYELNDVLTANKHLGWCHAFTFALPEYDWAYLLEKENADIIERNITHRQSNGDIYKLHNLHDQYTRNTDILEKEKLWQEMLIEAGKIPNRSHPATPIGPEINAKHIATVGTKKEFSFVPKSTSYLGRRHDILRTGQVTLTTGQRSYYFMDELVRLEEALVLYSLSRLKKQGFTMVSVPDLLHPAIIESCGFPTTGERTQVYRLDERHGDVCLAGTSEMSLAGMLMNETHQLQDLPLKFATVSRCYRAETSRLQTEKDLYRVHQFTKVEMFGVTANEKGDESDILHRTFLDIQTDLYTQLGLHFRILEMSTEELGNSAYRKFDIETWLPDRQFWGEISSTSNCTDYQSRRLCMRYRTPSRTTHLHTVNGTACAVPRLVMAILENNQTEDGSIEIPAVLQPYMGGLELLVRRSKPSIRWQKSTKTGT